MTRIDPSEGEVTEPTEVPPSLLHGVGWATSSQIVSTVAGAGALVIAGRTLGVEGQGLYALALVVPYLGQLLFNAGLGIANLHFIASGRAEPAGIVENTMVLTLASTAIGALVAAALVTTGAADVILPEVSGRMIAIAFVSLPFLLLRGSLSGVLRGMHDVRTVVLVEALERVLNLVVLAGCAVVGILTVELALTAAVVASAVSAAAILRTTAQRVPEARLLRARLHRPLARSTLRMAMPVYLGNAIQYLNYRLDLVFVGALAGVVGVGLYSVSYRIAEMLLIVPNAIGFVHVSRAASDVEMRLQASSIRLFWASASLVAGASAVVALVARPAITLVFGADYEGAVTPLILLLPGIIALAAGGVLTNDLAGRGRAAYNAWGSAGALVVTVVLDVWLVPDHGAVGAAIASTVAYSISLAVGVFGFVRVTGATLGDLLQGWCWWRDLRMPRRA